MARSSSQSREESTSTSSATPESKASSATTTTRPTSVSSAPSELAEESRSLEKPSSSLSSSSNLRSEAVMPPKTQTTPSAANTKLRPKHATRTRRSLGATSRGGPARQTSASSTAPLLGRKSQSTRNGEVSKYSILHYLQPVSGTSSNRQLSGATLVETKGKPHNASPKTKRQREESEPQRTATPKKRVIEAGLRALDNGWNVERLAIPIEAVTDPKKSADKRRSTRVAKVAEAVAATAATLGQKGREALENGKKKLQGLGKSGSMGKRKLDESGSTAVEAPSSKRTKLSLASDQKSVSVTEDRLIRKPVMSKKTWLTKGLYVGQQRGFDVRLSEASNQKKKGAIEAVDPRKEREILPMPMFGGELLLKRGRDFKLPFDVFSPLPPGQPKPDEWWKKQKNRFIGEAATEWKKSKPLPPSRCLCAPEDGCSEDCQNRYMLYECDETNCSIGPEHCTNRAFAQLKERSKSGKKYHIGVEVVKTVEKGFGVRSNRTFEPNQIIVEYTGEIITQEECERRMREEYKNNECYYLMTFDQNMIIDATRGSIARFVNHSCEPNCRMIKWTVAGQPRMALFAGDKGITTGEELTYDYNFDPFSQKNVQICRCGAARCRGVLGPRLSKDKEAKLLKDKLPENGKAIVKGAKQKLKEALEAGAAEKRKKKQAEAAKKKPRGTGIWAGKWEWVPVPARR